MSVVHEEVAAERARSVVVNAACAVCDVTHDEGFHAGAEGLDDVGEGAGEEEEALGHLQGHPRRRGLADVVDGLVDFEVVVGW